MSSANQCLNEQFLLDIREDVWRKKEFEKEKRFEKEKWQQKRNENKNKINKGTKTVSIPTEDSEQDGEN